MSRNVIAVYPGTFDPITLGHVDLVRRAAQLFDSLIVVVSAAPHKKTLFSLEERMDMAREAAAPYPQVQVESFDGLMRDFVRARGAKVMVRGLRSGTDVVYKAQLAGMNRTLLTDVRIMSLTPGDKYQFLSSTFVREIATLGGEVDTLVSPHVQQRLMAKLRAPQKG